MALTRNRLSGWRYVIGDRRISASNNPFAEAAWQLRFELGETDRSKVVLVNSSFQRVHHVPTRMSHDDDKTATEFERTTKAKHQIETALYEENKAIRSGQLKDENPLDRSADFRTLCEASRRGDLRLAQEQITKGVNPNARDDYDYTPLILASLCGHFELVQMLLEQGARCERDTFQGERCLYNALNDRIRNLLLSYDYSKSTDPLQPLAAHITSLLTRYTPKTVDITLHAADASFHLHKFVLSARSPYFRRKLHEKPSTTSWKLSNSIPTDSFETCIRYLYFGEASVPSAESDEEQELVLSGVDKLSKQLEVPQIFESLLSSGNRRQARQRREEEVAQGRDQVAEWFEEHVLRRKVVVDHEKAEAVQWPSDNGSFADVLLRADEEADEGDEVEQAALSEQPRIPIGAFRSRSTSRRRKPRKATLFPAHRAMLLRSEVFSTMFSSPFREGQIEGLHSETCQPQPQEHEAAAKPLQIVPVDCPPEVLDIVLRFLYTETADFPLSLALDVLHAADMLFIEKLKQRAALLISTLGNGQHSVVEAENPRGETGTTSEEQPLDWIYEVVRSGWDCRVHRLEEFGARYIAYRLEQYIDEEEFKDLVRESASRIQKREETDTVELVDDIRYYLSERFRLRFEDAGLDEMMDESQADPVVAVTSDLDDERTEKAATPEDEGYSGSPEADGLAPDLEQLFEGGIIRTLDGDVAGDEFAQDAINYQILLGKIDALLDDLTLDA